MGNKGSNTTTQTTSAAPEAMAAYRSLLERASAVASQPYTPYGGDLSAGFNDQQQTGVAGINQNAGFALPFLQSAQGYATQAGAPITAEDIARYQNPYQQQVVDATQSHFDRQNAGQQNELRSRAAMAGALGGSSPRIAAADMAYQQQQGQAPAIAGLYRQGFDTALSAAQRQQQQAGQTAGLMGNLGISGQQAMLSGAGAQFGVGQAEQQTEQQELDRLYQQFQIQQAFPYMQTQWLSGINTGVGSQMGGTASTTAPSPSLFSQIAGAGMAGLGLAGGLGFKPFAARGGRIPGFAAGGPTEASQPYGGVGWIPQIGITRGSGAPNAPRAASDQSSVPKMPGFASRERDTSGVPAPLVNYNPAYEVPGPRGGFGAPAPILESRGAQPEASSPRGGFIPEDLRMPLITAGLAMMASRSPHALSAIGEGGLAGVGAYSHQQDKKRSAQQQQRKFDIDTRRLDQAAERAREDLALRTKMFGETSRHHRVVEQQAWKPVLTDIGRDPYGNPIRGIFDPRTQTTKPIAAGTTETENFANAPVKPPAPPPAQLSEDDTIPANAQLVSGNKLFLSTLPQSDQQMIKAMVEGRQPPPPGRALAQPYWRRMMELANAYDPSFDQGRWSARVQTRKNFATGVEGRIVRSLNTVMNHIDELDEAGKELDNFQGIGPATKTVNEIRAKLKEHSGDPKITRFETASNAVSTELEKAFRGSQTAISGIKEWRKSMSPSMSPEQMKESNKTLAKLLMGQLEGLAGQYSAGMGVNADPLTILQPSAAKTVQKLLGTLPEGAAGGKPDAQGGIDQRDEKALRANANNPAARAAIDKKYGEGTAARILGE